MSWSNKYVGIPYVDMGRNHAGCDCWGLARLVYAEQLDATLPDYAGGYASAEEQAEVASLIGGETAGAVWVPVSIPQSFDLLLYRHGRHNSHIGIFVAPGLMLHMATDDQSKLERTDAGRWPARRVGVYRYYGPRSKGGS